MNSPKQEMATPETPNDRLDLPEVEAQLASRLERFDSYWQAPKDVEKGYKSFYQYYKANFLPHIPADRNARIAVVSCGPGYLVNLLNDHGYKDVIGIDSDPEKIAQATARNLNCEAAYAFTFFENRHEEFDVVICEQELNHLTLEEMVNFLKLCAQSLRPSGLVIVYGLNGANPLVGSENLAHNIDHFNTFTEHSLHQVLELANFSDIRVLPLKLYVFWTNPLNYVGLLVTGFFSLFFRCCFVLYGKKVKILTKKIAATARKKA